MKNTETAIYENKMFEGVTTLAEALKIPLTGLKAITRREKTRIYNEYKETERMDLLRIVKCHNINTETNLAL